MKVSTKFNVDTTIRCLVIVIAVDTLHNLVTLTFDPLTLVSGHTWRVTWSIHRPSSRILTAIRSWVMSSDISHRIPLTMRLQPLRMCRIMWPMRRWQIFPAYLKSVTQISIYNFYGATIKTNGVIRQYGAWRCAKDHTAFCACAKSCQYWTLP